MKKKLLLPGIRISPDNGNYYQNFKPLSSPVDWKYIILWHYVLCYTNAKFGQLENMVNPG